jgi:predicted glycosyltransferase
MSDIKIKNIPETEYEVVETTTGPEKVEEKPKKKVGIIGNGSAMQAFSLLMGMSVVSLYPDSTFLFTKEDHPSKDNRPLRRNEKTCPDCGQPFTPHGHNKSDRCTPYFKAKFKI